MRSAIVNEPLVFMGYLLGIGLGLAASGLVWHQLRHRDGREALEKTDQDRTYFRNQDRRRALGIALMILASLALLIASTIYPGRVGAGEARADVDGGARADADGGARADGPEPDPRYLVFASLWLLVAFTVVLLLILAFLDSVATYKFARRQEFLLKTSRRLTLEQVFEQHRREQRAARGPLQNGATTEDPDHEPGPPNA